MEGSCAELDNLLDSLMDPAPTSSILRTSSQDTLTLASASASDIERTKSSDISGDPGTASQQVSDDTKSTEDSGPLEEEEDMVYFAGENTETDLAEIDEGIATEVLTEEERRTVEERTADSVVEWEWRIFYPRCEESPTLRQMFRNLAWDDTTAEIREDCDEGRSIFMLTLYCPDLQIHCDVSSEHSTATLRPRMRLQREGKYNCESWVNCNLNSLLTLNAKTRKRQVLEDISQMLAQFHLPTAKAELLANSFKPTRDVLEIRCRKIQTSLYQSLINETDQLVAAQTDFDVFGDKPMGSFRSVMLRSASLAILHRVLEANNIPTRSTEGDVEGWPEFICNLWKRGKRMPIFLRTSSTRVFQLLERQPLGLPKAAMSLRRQ